MNSYILNGREYYLAEDLYRLEPQSFPGCSKTSRLMLTRRNIPETEYIYCAWIKSRQVWEPKNPEYRQAKPFISVEWARANVTSKKKPEEKTEEDAAIEARTAPPLLSLDDDQMFRDEKGDIIDIEIRGRRDMDAIFFKLKDVSEKFDIPNIKSTIMSQKGDWVKGEDYVVFYDSNPVDNAHRNTNKLFLTYEGMIRYLYVSRSKNAKHFQKWANRILFTHQLGSRKEKRAAAASLLGADPSSVKEAFRADARSLPCVYLFSLGKVDSLRDIMSLPETAAADSLVFKYGFTRDLPRRTSEHQKTFEKCELLLKYFSYIDPQYCAEAEGYMKRLFQGMNMHHSNELSSELAIVPQDKLKFIREHYETMGVKYMGHVRELIVEIERLKAAQEIERLKAAQEIEKLKAVHAAREIEWLKKALEKEQSRA